MNPTLKNVVGLVVGLLVGGTVNMLIITFGSGAVPPPEGVDPNDVESIKAHIHLYEFKHWIVPFLAHAIGTLVGAFLAAKVCASHKKTFAVVVGAFFLVGGIMMASMLDYPMPFTIIDLVIAYIPMGLLGWKLGR